MHITVVIPALNEEAVLAASVRSVCARLRVSFPHDEWLVVAVDNASDDGTSEVAADLAAEEPNFRYERLAERGKGLAVREGWSRHPGDVNVFMDADLAVDLAALGPLVEAVRAGADMAIGSRYHPASTVHREWWRRVISLGFRSVLRLRLGLKAKDAPCGFKAVSRRVLEEVVPLVRNDRWFFDTELLVLAERAGLRVAEVPVTWKERRRPGAGTRVNFFKVTAQYLAEVERLRKELRG